MNRKHSLAVAWVVCVLWLPALSTAEEKAIEQTWSKTKAWQWYNARPWINGCNYLPSYAGNSTEFWQADTFDPQIIDKELALAAGVGYNSIRVLMQYLVWENNPEGYKKRFSTFLEIADRHGLSVMPQFFDDCAFGLQPDEWKRENPYLGKQDDPIPGGFFPNWTPSPGHSRVGDESAWPRLKKYMLDFMATFKRDKRILAWDLYNEPTGGKIGDKTVPLLKAVFRWAREIKVSQPITSGIWNGNHAVNSVILENSDIITFHQYPAPDPDRFEETGRPVICTEWMIRIRHSLIHKDIFAKTLPVLKEKKIGSYSWGLVNGRSQAQFQWGSKPGTPEPEVWFTDIFRDTQGTPYDPTEIEVIRRVSGSEPAPASTLCQLFETLIAERQVVGAQVAVGDAASLLLVKSFGLRSVAGTEPVDDDTLFCIGSCSKMFAAAVIMTLVDDGTLELDTPIDRWLPAFSSLRLQGAATATVRAPTLRELLCHRAGIFSQKRRPTRAQMELIRDFRLTLKESVDGIACQKLIAQPGSEYAYSGAGYNVLGRVAEVATGATFDELLSRRICQPLGLTATTYFPWPAHTNIAVGHDLKDDGLTVNETTPHLLAAEHGLSLIGGSIYCPAREAAHFAQMLLYKGAAGGRVVLTENAWQQMATFQSTRDQGAYGFGLCVTLDPETGQPVMLSHSGSLSGSCSNMMIDLRTRRFGFAAYTGCKSRQEVHNALLTWVQR